MGTGEVKEIERPRLIQYWIIFVAIIASVVGVTTLQVQLVAAKDLLKEKADHDYVEINFKRLEEKINAMKELQIRSDLNNNLQEILRRLPERRPSE